LPHEIRRQTLCAGEPRVPSAPDAAFRACARCEEMVRASDKRWLRAARLSMRRMREDDFPLRCQRAKMRCEVSTREKSLCDADARWRRHAMLMRCAAATPCMRECATLLFRCCMLIHLLLISFDACYVCCRHLMPMLMSAMLCHAMFAACARCAAASSARCDAMMMSAPRYFTAFAMRMLLFADYARVSMMRASPCVICVSHYARDEALREAAAAAMAHSARRASELQMRDAPAEAARRRELRYYVHASAAAKRREVLPAAGAVRACAARARARDMQRAVRSYVQTCQMPRPRTTPCRVARHLLPRCASAEV